MEQKNSNIPVAKEYLTTAQVAQKLNVSTFTIHRLIKRRAIPFIAIGAIRRFDPVAIDEWMNKRTVTGQ